MLEKTYQPADIEARIHAEWEKAGAFKCGRPERAGAPAYSIVIPPPNVTGSLHMGHALNNTLQDVLCRFERMRGKDVLWQPGTDHAGIATQLVVERRLMERQQHRRDMGRERFIEEVWKWKDESGSTIINQLKRLGASCDWSRERFTMDEGLSRAVLKVFVDLYNQGLINKDKRLVNWDPEFQSAVSDLEVDSIEVNGHLWHFKYPLKDDPSRFIIVATTRPETMLGDTAVAVHPDDERYKDLIGKLVVLPLVGREIPIVADAHSDPEKGSGAVKITPAHDFNDFDVGKRHKLDVINIFDAQARLNENAPEAYRGLDRFVARKKVVADLEGLGLVDKIEPHTHAVPHAQRGNAVIEPWLTDQWYVDAATLAKPAMAAVREGKTRIVPERFANDYFRWMENIQPWCISRQLWWGHQIPAWYGPAKAGSIGNNEAHKIFVAASEEEALAAAREYYGREVEIVDEAFEKGGRTLPNPGITVRPGIGPGKILISRDPDVLDTWFSSGLWPFSTLGWPDKTPELARYYPTNCLVTAFDILFFWVARMMMLGQHFMHEVPFHDVLIHGLIRDEKGRKMSKTLGNVVDPLELIDAFGADALRFSMAAMAAQGSDVKFAKPRIEGYRNFATKLWNAARFAEMNGCVRVAGFDPKAVKQTLNRWIAGETERAVKAVSEGIESYKFNEAASAVYQFVWGTFCDWYVELAKPLLTGSDEAARDETRATAAWALDQILALLHPFTPFVTEELWAKTGEQGPARQGLLALAAWPELSGLADAEADAEIGWLVHLISEVRSVRSDANVPAGAKIPLVIAGASDITKARAERHAETIKRLARIETIAFEAAAPKGSAQIVVGEATVALPLAGIIDMDAERKRITREIDKTVAEIKKVTDRLANPGFMAKAPPEVVDELKERGTDFETKQSRLKLALQRIEA
ncbi:MAG: valine--tRNA ligase [Hyphomicrobiaceae bacterium]